MGERKESFKLIKNEILRYYQNKKAVDAHKRRIEGIWKAVISGVTLKRTLKEWPMTG